MYLETTPTAYDRSGQVWVRYKMLPTSYRYRVLSTIDVSQPSSSLTPYKKGVVVDLQFIMWSPIKRSRVDLSLDRLMPEASSLISRAGKKWSGPMSVIENLSCRVTLTATIVEAELSVIKRSSTYNTRIRSESVVFSM